MKKFAGFLISGGKSFYGQNCSVEGLCGRVDVIYSANGENPRVFVKAYGSMAYPACSMKISADTVQQCHDTLLPALLPMGGKYWPALLEALKLLRHLPEPSLKNCNPTF